MPDAITCRCGDTWTGLNRAHCSICHRTFGGITGFDKHRDNEECLEPETIGYHLNKHNIWVGTYGV